MAFTLAKTANAEQAIATANYPDIRLFSVPQSIKIIPSTTISNSRGWQRCTPEIAGSFSGVGYYFALELHLSRKVAVGIINASRGSTRAEAWTSAEMLLTLPEFKKKVKQQQAKWDETSWDELVSNPDTGSKTTPLSSYHNTPSVLYNGMIAPLIPYGIKGVIWYQGEGNANKAEEYRTLFPSLISDWRKQFGQGNFPFLYVQLASMKRPGEKSRQWALLREAQLQTLKVPATAMAVAVDLGEQDNIHPKNKEDVAKRLVLAARKIAYGEEIVYTGPLLQSVEFNQSEARIRFTGVGSGLHVKDGTKIKGFTIAGADKQFHEASATIQGNEVIVTASEVLDPKAVRYAFESWPEGNLYNEEGLPASPFRTDDWDN
jgi:sialate O-acetylesterase